MISDSVDALTPCVLYIVVLFYSYAHPHLQANKDTEQEQEAYNQRFGERNATTTTRRRRRPRFHSDADAERAARNRRVDHRERRAGVAARRQIIRARSHSPIGVVHRNNNTRNNRRNRGDNNDGRGDNMRRGQQVGARTWRQQMSDPGPRGYTRIGRGGRITQRQRRRNTVREIRNGRWVERQRGEQRICQDCMRELERRQLSGRRGQE